MRAGFYHRSVPDSSQAEYNQFRFDLGYSYFTMNGYLNLESDLEARDYNQPSGRDDFWSLTFRGNILRTLTPAIELGGAVYSDLYRYRKPDIVNRNYFLLNIAGSLLDR